MSRQYGTKAEGLLDEDLIYAQNTVTTLKLAEHTMAALAETAIEDFQSSVLMIE